MKKITFIRHGETRWNVSKVMQGITNIPLSDNGQKQAEKIAEKLRSEKYDIIFSSDLNRAAVTAKFIRKFHEDTPIEYRPEIRERSHGIAEGLTWEETKEDLVLGKIISTTNILAPDFAFPGGESDNDLKIRIESFIKEILQSKYDNILIVCHEETKQIAFSILLEDKSEKFLKQKFLNTSVSIITINGDEKRVDVFNDVSHLEISAKVIKKLNDKPKT